MLEEHINFFVNSLTPIEFCGNTIMWQLNLDGAYQIPYKTTPTKGKHDFNKCKTCKNSLIEIEKTLKDRFDGKTGKREFPYCCLGHINLLNIKGFNRNSFVSVPKMVADKVIYTIQHINNNHTEENYYTIITDYISWTIDSFGQTPKNCGEPLFLSVYLDYVFTSLKDYIKDISEERRLKLLEYLNLYKTPQTQSSVDMQILIETYQKWFEIFPFEISYFAHLKPQFEKQLPIVNGKPRINIYSKKVVLQMHTKSSLIDVLLNRTNKLLIQINGLSLYEKGLLTEPESIKLELIVNERRLKLKQGYLNNIQDEEVRYREMLNNWFKDEKKFIDEITPLIKLLPTQEVKKEMPTSLEKTILFNNPETIKKLFAELKGFFLENKSELLLKALNGEQLSEFLLFPHQQNKFVEVFKRLKYNGFLTSTQTEIKNWICSNFTYHHQKGTVKEVRNFNPSTVWDMLTKNKDVAKKERICVVDWLPHKTHRTIKYESQKEKL